MLNKKNKILYVMPKYFDGVIYYCPMMPDIALIDWQLRLLSHLSKLGYEILVKPHPESQIDVPEFFKDSIGVKVLTEKFEKAYKKADILLIDYPGSTTFGFALKTKKPLIFIDFSYMQWHLKEKELLKKRCYIVKGKFLIDNRAAIDWNDLNLSLIECFNCLDTSYAKYVL